MQTPNVIDILANASHGSQEVREYWTQKGKVLLNRVYPFRYFKDEDKIQEYFDQNIIHSRGISVDEILAHRYSKKQIAILANVFKRLRENHPDKLVFAWDASGWNDMNRELLISIGGNCDFIIEEIYISQAEAHIRGFRRFSEKVHAINNLFPGIKEKTILGIGVHEKMNNMKKLDFKQHIENQILEIKHNPLLAELPGIAVYAPVHLSVELQKFLDNLLRKYYGKGSKSR
jgi:hypothetical protein